MLVTAVVLNLSPDLHNEVILKINKSPNTRNKLNPFSNEILSRKKKLSSLRSFRYVT